MVYSYSDFQILPILLFAFITFVCDYLGSLNFIIILVFVQLRFLSAKKLKFGPNSKSKEEIYKIGIVLSTIRILPHHHEKTKMSLASREAFSDASFSHTIEAKLVRNLYSVKI